MAGHVTRFLGGTTRALSAVVLASLLLIVHRVGKSSFPGLDHEQCGNDTQCVTALGGELYMCRQAGRDCVRLTSPECTVLADETDLANGNTVWVGLVTDETNRPLRRFSADLARREIATVGKGLPSVTRGGPRRPYALLACNSALGIDAIFQHLVGELRLPAIIGPQYSGETLHALTTYTLPAGTVMLAVNATAAVFTTLPSNGLFLRMLASDAFQAKVHARFVNEYVEPELRSEGVLAPGKQLRLFLAYRDDPYGQGIADVLTSQLRFNGKTTAENGARFQRADFGNPNDTANTTPDVKYASVAAAIVAMEPHVIAIAGSIETEKIIQAVERGWPAALPYRPRWIGTDGVGVVAARIGPLDTTFAGRFLTTTVRVDFAGRIAQHLHSAVTAEQPEILRRDPRSPTALAAYDAVYAMAYAIALLQTKPLTGSNIAGALRQLNQRDAPEAEVGQEAILDIYARLEKHQPFNLRGATGTLDWDVNGDVLQDIDILCVRTSTPTVQAPVPLGTKPSGLYYDVRGNRFVGRIANCPGP